MSLPSFTIMGTIFDLLGNVAGGEIVGNGLLSATGTPASITFTSNADGQFVHWSGDGSLDRVREVVATVNGDGSITRNGDVVKLLANDAGLSVDQIQWQCHVGWLRFWFNAPTDGGTVNLGSVAPVPGVSVVGLTSLDWNSVTGKPAFVGAGATAAAARAAIGIIDGAAALTPTAVKTTGYTAAVGDLIPANATSGGFTITLPNAPADKSIVSIKSIGTSVRLGGGAVTVQRAGSDVFNTSGGPTSLQLTEQGESVTLQYKASGAIWYVVPHGVPITSLDGRYLVQTAANPLLLSTDGTHVYITTTAGELNLDSFSSGIRTRGLKIATLAGVETFINHGMQPRVQNSAAPGATPTLAWDSYDQINLTGINAAITSMSSGISGTRYPGQKVIIRFKDNGTARAITWGASYRAVGVTLPTTTVISKTLYVGAIYNSTDTIFDVIAVAQEA